MRNRYVHRTSEKYPSAVEGNASELVDQFPANKKRKEK
jgi:hypothetical protein